MCPWVPKLLLWVAIHFLGSQTKALLWISTGCIFYSMCSNMCAQKNRCWGRIFRASSFMQLKLVIFAFGRLAYLWLTRRMEEIQQLIQGDTFPIDEIILPLLLIKYISIKIWGVVFKYLVSIWLIYMPVGKAQPFTDSLQTLRIFQGKSYRNSENCTKGRGHTCQQKLAMKAWRPKSQTHCLR